METGHEIFYVDMYHKKRVFHLYNIKFYKLLV